MFDVEPPDQPRAGWSSRWAVAGALALIAAVTTFGRSPETTAPDPPVPTTVEPAPVDVPEPTRFVGADVIVAPTQAGVVAISTATGERHEFVLDPPIRTVDAGPGSSVILVGASGELLVLDLVNQRVEGVGADDHRSVEASIKTYQPSDAFLEHHRLLVVADELILGEICGERRCRLEQRSLLRLEGPGVAGGSAETSWEPIPPRPAALVDMAVSADGKWFTTNDGVLALYRTDRGGVSLVHTAAVASGFSSDGTTLYILTDSRLEAVDLIGDEFRSVDIGRLPTLTGEAVVVAA